MKRETIINSLMQRPIFQEDPPVLVDVGASGGVHEQWQLLAPHSICLAFDPDQREMHRVQVDSRFKELHIIGAALNYKDAEQSQFYLTKSPFCSSLLEPDAESLKQWSFGNLFEIVGTEMLPSTTPVKALADHSIKRVDWYKSDTQGLDLSIFQAFPDEVRRGVVALEFEPGILDAYKKENKLYKIIEYMDALPYWMESLTVKGPERLNLDLLAANVPRAKAEDFQYGNSVLPGSPGWAEVRYLRDYTRDEIACSERNLLFAIVAGLISDQWGYALEVAAILQQKHASDENDQLAQEIYTGILKKSRAGKLRKKVAGKLKRIFSRFL